MKKAFLLSLAVLILTASVFSQETAWSAPIKGLRARLFVLPLDKTDSPFCRVMIEMQNVDNVMGQKRIRFNPDRLELHVTDQSGKKFLKPYAGPYDGLAPFWETTLLPYAGTINFQISFPGSSYDSNDKVIVDIDSAKTWKIPQDGATYLLSGKLAIERQNGDHPYMDWSGTLELPAVEIPKAK